MALRKPAQEVQFEEVSTTLTQEQEVMTEMNTTTEAANEVANEVATEVEVVAAAPIAAPAPAPAPAPVAVRPAVTSSVAVLADVAAQAKAFQRELDEMKGAADFSFGNYTVFKGNNGEIAQTGDNGVSFGRWVKVRLLAWDDHFETTPGSQDKGSKEFVAYSKDGKVIDHVIGEEQKKWVGGPVTQYVDYLRETEGFDKASTKRYVDLSVAVLGSDSGEEPESRIVQLVLSQSSITSFTKYQQYLKDTARCIAMGLPGFSMPEDPFTFFVIREVVSSNGNKWTKLTFNANLPAKL